MQVTLGRPALSLWPLDPDVIYLNHGTVGATPRRVLARQQTLRDEMERRPSSFLLREAVPLVGAETQRAGLIRQAAEQVAKFVGVQGDDLGFVQNVTAGINAVLRSLSFSPGDEILVLDHAYGAIVKAAAAIGGAHGAVVRRVPLPAVFTDPQQAIDAVTGSVTACTRLAIIDHITSPTALLMPIAEVVSALQAQGVPVLVDGAHAPGAVPLDVTAIGADWYAANLHKWAWAPRSCGFLHARRDRQDGLHAPILSWGLDRGLTAELDWQGTYDPTPMLAAPEGLALLAELGTAAVQQYNHALAWRAACALRDELGATLIAPEAMVGSMVTVALPAALGTEMDHASALRDRLLFQHRIEVQVQAASGRLQLRLSAQIYNDDNDVEALLRALSAPTDGRSP